MISHGIVSGALFLSVGVIYDRIHTREIAAYGGLADRMPVYAFIFMVFTMANAGLPGTSGFIGEFLSLLGTFSANSVAAFFATFGIILSAIYALSLYRRVIFGKLEKPSLATISDMSAREIAIMAPLLILTLLLGFYPKPVFDTASGAVNAMIAPYQQATAARQALSAAPQLAQLQK
jgi:NADH-quinone oxidoreductase subunit M